ncbi:Gfo/Idh/MocA family oxidoreductase [Rhodobacterales bacterium]|nr:Gfo/Idh/MocA family oxidoreductase [Rhodobacterales bacterium]
MIKVLVVGLGNMGLSHALAHTKGTSSQLVGLVARSPRPDLPDVMKDVPYFRDFDEALAACKPDLVVVASYTDTHKLYALKALEAGAHVFCEKPLAPTVAEAEEIVAMAEKTNRKLMIGYILRVHPSWQRLVQEARALGGPYVFRMNLNQQSSGHTWETHKSLMQSVSPIVDCGVHYVDVMCQVTDARPVKVHGIGLRLSDEIAEDMYNYGQFQVTFSDGSVGWYEAGWGPMMSETAHFVKDIISPAGSVSIADAQKTGSDNVDTHTSVGQILVHRPDGDSFIDTPDEPGHQELCDAEQAAMVRAIEEDEDLTRHMRDAVQSLRVCLAADESIRTGASIDLSGDPSGPPSGV